MRRIRRRLLSQSVLDLLAQLPGGRTPRKRSNGLAQLAGGWREEEHGEFEAAIAETEQVDKELWL